MSHHDRVLILRTAVYCRGENNTERNGGLLVLAARLTKPVLAIKQLHSATDVVTLHTARRVVDLLRLGGPMADVIVYVISNQNKHW